MADTLDLDPEWGAIDLIEELEETFKFKMTNEEAERCCTVGDVYEVLRSHTEGWDEQSGNCSSSMTFYRLRNALGPDYRRSITPSTPLISIGLKPSELFDVLSKRSGLRLPSHSLNRLGMIGSCLMFAGVILSIVALFNSHWLVAGAFALIAGVGLVLVWRDPGRLPNGIVTFGDLVTRSAPLNAMRLQEMGGKPSDRWSVLTAIAAEYGQLQPNAISPETFLHRKSLDEALAA